MELEYTWQVLGTGAGGAAAVLLITQYAKMPLDKVWKIPTRLLVFLLSAVIVTGAHLYYDGALGWQDVLLLLVNAVIVALTAMGGYEMTFAKLEQAATPARDEEDLGRDA